MTEVITPITLKDLSPEKMEEFIEALRARRAVVQKQYSRARRAHAETSHEALRQRLDSKLLKLEKKLAQLEKSFSATEALIMEIIALRLAYGELPEELTQ